MSILIFFLIILSPILMLIAYQLGLVWFIWGASWFGNRKTRYLFHNYSASFWACDYYMSRIKRFKTSGTYQFDLTLNTEKGKLVVRLFDKNKKQILRLDESNKSASIAINSGEKYLVKLDVMGFTGSYEFDYDCVNK